MASNSRILTTDGKSTNGTKHFGLTVKDRQSTTTPNMTQLTIIPAVDTIQNHRFILGTSNGATAATTALSVTPDMTLLSTRFYQFHAYLTVILKDNNTYYTGHYSITSAAKGTAIIGGTGGYRLDNICSEDGMDNFLSETAITLAISGNNFVVTITPTADVSDSIDIMVDVVINSGLYTP